MASCWSSDSVEKLIQLYRDRPLLWNGKLDGYHDKRKRLVALQEIVQELGKDFSVEEVKKKMNNLRTRFNQERAKIAKAKHSTGSRVAGPVTSKWRLFKRLNFLPDSSLPRQSMETHTWSVKQESRDYDNDGDNCLEGSPPVPPPPGSPSSTMWTRGCQKKRPQEDIPTDTFTTAGVDFFHCCKEQDADVSFGNYIAHELTAIRNTEAKRRVKLKIMSAIFETQELESG
ncbi:UNVERIFIED_CONTAM: hypothetical protein FKN15_050688 [Acipenser sinensis]